MKKENLLLVLLALFLLAAMFYTLFAGGNSSRHGYGQIQNGSTETYGNPVMIG